MDINIIKTNMYYIVESIKNSMGWEDSQAWDWMTTKKSVWENKSPAEMIVKGKHQIITDFIEELNDDVLSKLLKLKGDLYE